MGQGNVVFECIVNYLKGIECTNYSKKALDENFVLDHFRIEGTPTEVYKELYDSHVTDLEGFDLEDIQFPKNEIAFGMALKGITSLLNRVGIAVIKERESGYKRRIIIKKTNENRRLVTEK
jgi:hypothetical protein